MKPIPEAKPGQPISAAAWNIMREELIRQSKMSVVAPLSMSDGPRGRSIRLQGTASPSNIVLSGKVYSASGAAGDSSTLATWAYTVKDLKGNVLGGTGSVKIQPQFRDTGKLSAAADSSYCTYCFDGSTLVLLQVNEKHVWGTRDCS